MVFKLARTFGDPAAGANPQRGFPAPGQGAQASGEPSQPKTGYVDWTPAKPTQGVRSWPFPETPTGEQQGFPSPLSFFQRRPPKSMPARQTPYGQNVEVWTPYYSRGADAFVQNYGKVLTNPIGAGVVAKYRPQASYGPAAQYANGAIWWTSQAVPTSVNLQGLTSPQQLAAMIDPINLQAMVRVG